MCFRFLLILFSLLPMILFSQSVGIGTATPSPSAALDISSTGKGLLIPRMTTEQREMIMTPADGLLVYDTTEGTFYYRSGGIWTSLRTARMLSDADGGTMIQVEETPNENKIRVDLGGYESIVIQRNANSDIQIIPTGLDDNIFIGNHTGNVNTGVRNTGLGQEAFRFNTTGSSNTSVGSKSLNANTTGVENTAVGTDAMQSNESGNWNCAFGVRALHLSEYGHSNTAIGYIAMEKTTTGTQNTAVGVESLRFNTTAHDNSAFGGSALYYNTVGNGNTAIGHLTLATNTSGDFNTAVGAEALQEMESGDLNTAVGAYALESSNGDENIALGNASLQLNNGDYNIGIGSLALRNNAGVDNIGIGRLALLVNEGDRVVALGGDAGGTQTTGNNCTFIGYSAESAVGIYSNATAIGNQSTVTASNKMRLGNSSITEIGGYAPWTDVSDGRYKRNVSENVHGLDFILKLRPVTYHLEAHRIASVLHEDDDIVPDPEALHARDAKEAILYTGFIAQEVEKVAMETGYDFSGVSKPANENDFYGLQYATFVVPLVKAVQEQQAIIQQQQEQINLLLQRVSHLEQGD